MNDIPEKTKKKVGIHARDFETASAIKKVIIRYPQYSFVRATVNSWKKRYRDGENAVI